jgi:hypothetical protein
MPESVLVRSARARVAGRPAPAALLRLDGAADQLVALPLAVALEASTGALEALGLLGCAAQSLACLGEVELGDGARS